MPWRPLPRIAFAVATNPFQPASPADLPLELGDELYIIEEGGRAGAWLRGYLVAPPSLLSGLTSVKGQTLEARVFSGIFPRSCVEVRELLGATGAEALIAAGYGNGRRAEKEGDEEVEGEEEQAVNGDDALAKKKARRRSGRWSAALGAEQEGDGARAETTPSQGPPVANGIAAGGKLVAQAPSTRRSRGGSNALTLPLNGSPRPVDAPRPPAPVPMLKIGDETPTSSAEPLVDEIAACLREWHSTNLHQLLLSRRYTELERLSELFARLDLSRRQLLHGVLTNQELVALREQTVWDLVEGNKLLSNEIIVRDPQQRGKLLTCSDNPFEVSKLQATMSLLDKPPTPAPDRVNLHHLLFELRDATYTGKETPTLTVFLGLKRAGEPLKALTEAYTIDLPARDSPDSASQTAAQRTLFTDLTSIDTGEATGSATQLYLVIKARTNRAIQPTPSTSPRPSGLRESDAARKNSGSEASGSVGKGGRRSFMWKQSVRGGAARQRSNLASVTDESITSQESLDHEPEPSESSRLDTAAKAPAAQMVKKDVGVAVLHLKSFLSKSLDSEQTLSLWTPSESQEIQEGEDGWEEIIQSLLTSPSGRYSKLKFLDKVRFRIHSFLNPDAENLTRTTPTLLHNIPKTAKIGFSGAPTKPRSDIYITLQQAVLPGQALFSHPEKGAVPLGGGGTSGSPADMANLQLTLEVRRASGDRVEHCIFPSSNAAGATAWRTAAAPTGGVWAQTIRLAIPPDDVPDCHLIMSLADAPGFPFALCWMPLWRQGAFVPDGTHALLLHLYDKTTSSVTHGRGAYLDLPWDSKAGSNGGAREAGKGTDAGSSAANTPGRESWSNHMAHLQLESYLCSTAFSQDQTLLSLLRWREQTDGELLAVLRQLVFVPEIEIVKLVSDVFDALFAILVDRSGSDEYEDLVFSALVTVLGIVHDRRFNLGPLVNEYADVRFNYPFATPCLIRSFLRLITRPADYAHARQLRATFKVGRQIMRFIAVARTQQRAKEAGIGITNTNPVFAQDVRRLFAALGAQMRDGAPALVGSKTLIVQHLHAWLPELRPCFAPDEILDIAVDFLDACAAVQGKLVLHKLILVYNLGKTLQALPLPALRERFNAHVERWIAPYWGATELPNEQYREQVRLCCSILTLRDGDYDAQLVPYYIKILESYNALRHAPRPDAQTLSFLFPTAYPFPSRPTKSPRNYDENLIELAALKATISSEQLMGHVGDVDNVAEILAMALEVNMSLLEGEAFPSTWLTLHVYHHKVLLNMFDGLAQVMTRDLLPAPDEADAFDTALWKALQVAVLRLVRSQALALETLPEQKRRAVWKIAGDIREQGAELLGRIWDALGWDTDPDEKAQYGLNRLGGYQVQYVPSLVGPIVELCLSVHEGLRGVAVEILQSMIISEWTLNEDLAVVQAEMIYSLDDLFKSRPMGESAQQKLFVGQLLELFAPLAESAEKELWEATGALVGTIDRLLDLLVAVHAPEQSEALRIMNTLRLMDFLKNMQKEDIFISYVHQLAAVEAESRNFREAGLALGLHADLYAWDHGRRVEALTRPPLPHQTAFERKEALYFAMIRHFEEGGAWEPALACYRELADQYEHRVYDFTKLARTQRAAATIFERIARGEGLVSRYFRVTFAGLGFPTSLRGCQFVYEGSSSDRLASFMDRLQQQHPAAQFATQPASHDDEEGQYLQVTAVSPHRDLTHPLYQRHRVPLTTKEYLCGTSPSRFAVTTRRHSPKTGVRDQWVEKTIYTTAEIFPTILRRSEIVGEEVVSLSPLETAVERTVRKTSELVILEKRVRSGDTSSIYSMLEAIKTSIDLHSTTSVAQYRDILPRFSSEQAPDGEEAPPQLQPLELALQASLLDFTSGLRQCLNLIAPKMPPVDHQGLVAVFQSTFGPELAALAPPSATGASAAVGASDGVTPSLTMSEPRSPVTPHAPSVPHINGDHSTPDPHAKGISIRRAAKPAARQGSSRNRIASMLKRHPSISQPNGPGAGPALGSATMNGALDPEGAPAPVVGGGGRSGGGSVERHSMASSSHASAHDTSAPASRHQKSQQTSRQGSDAVARTNSEARPVTATSGAATSVGSLGGGVAPTKKPGSIRKRLSSTLGIGRKPSRLVLSGNEQGTLEEE